MCAADAWTQEDMISIQPETLETHTHTHTHANTHTHTQPELMSGLLLVLLCLFPSAAELSDSATDQHIGFWLHEVF